MLANLDNEVHFKKVFTDVTVFTSFVKDVLDIDINIKQVETEKMLPVKAGAIKFRMDLFAEDEEQRIVVEIQKVDYDYTYDRFTHYFTSNLSAMQLSSRTYSYAKDVYIIVVVTSAYRITDMHGSIIRDDVLLTDINPRTLDGTVRYMYNHKMVMLNSTHVTPNTPPATRDWLDLITESINNPENPHVNVHKPAIARAVELAQTDKITPEEIAESKIEEMRKIAAAKMLEQGKLEAEEKAEREKEQIRQEAAQKENQLRQEAEQKENQLRQEAEQKENQLRQEAEQKENQLRQEAEQKENQLRQEAEQKENQLRQEAEQKEIQMILNLYRNQVPIALIAQACNKAADEVQRLIEQHLT